MVMQPWKKLESHQLEFWRKYNPVLHNSFMYILDSKSHINHTKFYISKA